MSPEINELNDTKKSNDGRDNDRRVASRAAIVEELEYDLQEEEHGHDSHDLFHKEKHEHDDEMDMTALIDITFLLLIFFVVTSKLANEVKQPLPMARNGQQVANNEAIIISVRRGGGDSAVVSRNDGSVFSEDPEQQAAEIEEYIALGLNQNKTEMIIRADGGVRSGDIDRVKSIVSESLEEGQLISFAVHHEGR